MADALVIASGRSARHVSAIGENLARKLKEAGYGTRPVDGLAQGDWVLVDAGDAIVHIYAGGPALGREGKAPSGTGAIDHLSLAAHGFHEFRERFRAADLDWREFLVPGTTLWQLFVYDPSGVQLELTFDGSVEAGPPPDMRDGRRYVAGDSFFTPRV